MSCLLLYLLTCTTLLTCGAQEYYVTPTPPPNPNCPSDKPCHTLDYYANNASGLINGRENVSLLFMSGYHTSETIFEVVDVDIFTIAGLDLNFDLEIPSTIIGFTRMLISNGTVFTLDNIAISNIVLNVSNFQSMTNHEILCENSILSLRTLQVNSVLLTSSRLHQCAWLLYWGYSDEIGYYDPIDTAAVGISTKTDIVPTIVISETKIMNKSVTFVRLARSGTVSVDINATYCLFTRSYGLVITAHTVGQPLPESDLVIRMDHCSMTDGLMLVFGIIIIDAIKTQNVHIDISNCHFTEHVTGNKTIQLTSVGSNVNATVQDSDFLGAFGITAYVSDQSELELTVRKCNFMKARLDSIKIVSYREGTAKINGLIEDCQFIDGFNSNSSLITQDRVILVYTLSTERSTSIVLRNSLIMNNQFLTGILTIIGLIHMTIDNCTFKDNSAIVSGGLLAFYSNITFTGDTIFENNTGSTGGAIYLVESQLIFTENLNLVFLNNRADSTGGAIFVTEQGTPTYGNEIVRDITEPNPKCFYQLETDDTNTFSTKSSITFINNTAKIGGNNIYGAALKDTCTVTPINLTQSHEIQSTLFHFEPFSRSSVSSFPRRVCVCENGEPKCADKDYIFITKSVTPGEIISLEVILVGYDFGGTTGGIFATDLQNTNGVRLERGEEIQLLSSKQQCTTVNYSVQSINNTATTFILTSSDLNAEEITRIFDSEFIPKLTNESIPLFDQLGLITTELLYTPVFITAHILPCPLGLEINSTTGACQCRSELLKNLGTKCTVENGKTLISRKKLERSWFRIHNDSNHELIFEYGFSCLYAYCNSALLNIDPSNPDSQCAHNRSGVLCGGCAEGLSLAIGSSRCLECPDNSNVSLILVFLLLGIVLVLFIWILDLTISRGTINGLFFYVNMISINREIFFVENTGLDDTLNNCLRVAQLFIEWCNLDLGLESCFIDRLNAMGKVWLQFLFPLYVWSLAGLIIVASKYSPRLTKLFGNNSVSVLLTLFLVAYMKVVQTIIASLSYATIHQINNKSNRTVWLIDGNVNYDDAYHVFLCVVSGISAVLLSIVTVWLLLIKLTRKMPKHHKINPILDSFAKQLKKNHEYWIGLSLLTRVGFAIGTIVLKRDVLLTVLIIVLFILGFTVSQVYKKIYLSLLEFAFLLNLLFVSAIFLSQTNTEILAICISVSVLFSALLYLGIIIYHVVRTVQRLFSEVAKYLHERRETKQKNKADNKRAPNRPTQTLVEVDVYSEVQPPEEHSKSQIPQTLIVADYSRYREELMDSTV